MCSKFQHPSSAEKNSLHQVLLLFPFTTSSIYLSGPLTKELFLCTRSFPTIIWTQKNVFMSLQQNLHHKILGACNSRWEICFKNSYLSKRSTFRVAKKQLRIWNKKVLLLVCFVQPFKWKQITYIYTPCTPSGVQKGVVEAELNWVWILFWGKNSGPFFLIYWQFFTQQKSIISQFPFFKIQTNIFLDFCLWGGGGGGEGEPYPGPLFVHPKNYCSGLHQGSCQYFINSSQN